MSLSDLSNIAQVVSGLAVLASLLYLSLQIRQNTLAHRASASEARRSAAREQVMMLTDPALAALVLRGHAGDQTMTAVENQRYSAFMSAFFIMFDEQFWMHDHGLLDDELFAAQTAVMLGYLSQPGARTAWQFWKSRGTPALQKFVDERLPAIAARPFVSFEERWKAAEAAANASTP